VQLAGNAYAQYSIFRKPLFSENEMMKYTCRLIFFGILYSVWCMLRIYENSFGCGFKRGNMELIELNPSEIYFSQDSINNVFDKKCAHSYKTIGETLDDLCENRYVNNFVIKIVYIFKTIVLFVFEHMLYSRFLGVC